MIVQGASMKPTNQPTNPPWSLLLNPRSVVPRGEGGGSYLLLGARDWGASQTRVFENGRLSLCFPLKTPTKGWLSPRIFRDLHQSCPEVQLAQVRMFTSQKDALCPQTGGQSRPRHKSAELCLFDRHPSLHEKLGCL